MLEAVTAAYGAIKVGPPTDPTAMMGPVISAAQRERCERFVALAEEHGGKVGAGGGRPAGLDRGYYFEPTVLDLPDNANPGGPGRDLRAGARRDRLPRTSTTPCASPTTAVYGLSGAGVRRRRRGGHRRGPADADRRGQRQHRHVQRLRARAAGYKQSGLGRERGTDGIRAFQEVKHMAIGELPAELGQGRRL